MTTDMFLFRLRPSILLFGDSLTQFGFGTEGQLGGWASRLAAAYTRRADVLNRGFSGYNTQHLLDLLPRLFGDNDKDVDGDSIDNLKKKRSSSLPQGILFCTVWIGTNDAALPGWGQHVPIEQYGDNLLEILHQIKRRVQPHASTYNANGIVPIVVLTPPPVHEEMWAEWRQIESPDRTNLVARSYGLRVQQVVSELPHCHVIDTWELLQGADPDPAARAQHLSDGVHLSESGNRLVFLAILKLLGERYPDLLPMGGDEKHEALGIPLDEERWQELVPNDAPSSNSSK